MKGRSVLVEIDSRDAAIIGTTLQVLASASRCPDIEVVARLQRVGELLAKAGLVDLAIANLDQQAPGAKL